MSYSITSHHAGKEILHYEDRPIIRYCCISFPIYDLRRMDEKNMNSDNNSMLKHSVGSTLGWNNILILPQHKMLCLLQGQLSCYKRFLMKTIINLK